MHKRVYSAIAIVAAIASITVATLVAAQKAGTQRTTSASQGRSRQGAAGQRNAGAQTAPIRPPDPNRAPQSAVNDALYTTQEFFGANASVARPYAVALERVDALLGQYPKDARLHLHAARLAERVGQF